MPFSTSRRSALRLLGTVPLAGATLAAASGTAAARPAAPPKDLRPGGAYDRFVAEQAELGKFSGTVLVAHRGRLALLRSHGMANTEHGIPNRPDTVFWLASITKCFTAVALGQLAERGKIAFHDTLGTYLTGFPAEIANTVTVHHLLTHTSGIGRPSVGSGSPPGLGWNSFDEVMDGTLALLCQTPLQFVPGTRYEYSNDGFFVLGSIVARVAGQSYFDYVRQHVFTPAGMSRTDFHSRPQVLADQAIARPYWTQPSGGRADFAASPYAPFTTGPAGGAYSTVTDLLAFARALTAGKLVTPAFTQLLTSGKVALPPSQPPSQTQFYGYGHLESIVNNQRIVGHSGSTAGATTRLDVHPDRDWVSIVLSNYDTTINPIVDLSRQLITT